MKIFIVLFLICNISLLSQNNSFDKEFVQEGRGKVTLKESLITNKSSYLPSDKLKRHKIELLPSVDINIRMFLNEYIKGKYIPQKEYEEQLITSYFCKANTKFKAEVFVDTIDRDKLTISVLTPEFIGKMYKKVTSQKVFKSIIFKENADPKAKTVPFLLIYEDDLDSSQAKLIQHLISNNSLDVELDLCKSPFVDMDRFMIIFIEK